MPKNIDKMFVAHFPGLPYKTPIISLTDMQPAFLKTSIVPANNLAVRAQK